MPGQILNTFQFPWTPAMSPQHNVEGILRLTRELQRLTAMPEVDDELDEDGDDGEQRDSDINVYDKVRSVSGLTFLF